MSTINFSASFFADVRRLMVSLLFLTTPGTYDVEIIVTAAGNSTSISTTFTVQALPNFPVLQLPPSSTTFQQGQTLNFGWQLTANTVDYELQIATDEVFDNVVYSTITTSNVVQLSDFSSEGQFYWRVIARNECGDAVPSPSDFFIQPVAVHDLGADRQLSVSPNPTAGPLFLSLTGNWSAEPLDVSVHDLTGRLLLERSFATTAGEHRLDLGRLPGGTYLVAVVVGRERIVERIVVMR